MSATSSCQPGTRAAEPARGRQPPTGPAAIGVGPLRAAGQPHRPPTEQADDPDPAHPVEGPSGELVIHPAYRRRHFGLALVRALAVEAGLHQLRLWAHGDLPAAGRLAAAAGFERIRALWQMRRSLQAQLDKPQLADGITIRTSRVGEDEDEWTTLNRRAFATHPEQGAWTRADLDLREKEPWFNPEGFFLAE